MLRAKAARMQLHDTPNACAMRPGHNQKEERGDVDWKLIFHLSLFGLAMAIATVFVIPCNIEPAFWLVIFLLCAFLIARRRPNRHFLHGLLVGIVNSVCVSTAHIVFFSQYIANHSREAAMMSSMPLPNSPRLMMACAGPIVAIISGAIIGLFAYAAGKLIRPRVRTPA
jgi:Mn2+/Fe2+ NRAMP family transporter